jgi:hypothetical protein
MVARLVQSGVAHAYPEATSTISTLKLKSEIFELHRLNVVLQLKFYNLGLELQILLSRHLLIE